MRAILVVNPAATTTTERTLAVIVSALEHDLKVDVVQTSHRGHAAQLARQAAVDGLDLVVVLGGDGTVNEVVNGLLATGPSEGLPDLAVVPGGSTNVFARAVGIPRDPVEATGAILTALRTGLRRPVGLGLADDRWFTFSAGLGFDAEVVGAVEKHRKEGEPHRAGLYLRTAVRQFFLRTDRRVPALTLQRPGLDPVPGLFLGIVSNASPWTYLGGWPVRPSPAASFDAGLDLFALRGLGTLSTLRQIQQLVGGTGRGHRGRHLVSLHDQPEFSLVGSRAVAFEIDGEYLGERAHVTFRSVPRALRVLV